MRLLGHKTLAMTRRYSRLSPDVMKDAVNAMDDIIENKGTRQIAEYNGHKLGAEGAI